MKKTLIITLGLAALFGLPACVEKQEINPTFDPVKNEVNTQFYFNISASAGDSDPATKQADTNVQANGNFRGIDNATLFAIKDPSMTTSSAAPMKKMVNPTESAAAMRDLSSILQREAIPSTQKGGTRIVEINLPVGTNQLVFYAKAARQEIPGLDSRELYGSLQYTTTTENYINLKNLIGSYAERRLAKEDSVAFSNIERLIVLSFNGLFRTAIKPGTVDTAWYESRVPNATVTFGNNETWTIPSTLYWADYACAAGESGISPYFKNGTTPASASELERILGNAYAAFSSSKYQNDIRAGSGRAGARNLSDLYNIVSAGANATPVNIQEAVAQLIFRKLTSSIERLSDPLAGSMTSGRSWKSVTAVRDIVLSSLAIDDKYSLDRFPEQMHMPLGAVTVGKDSIYSFKNSLLPENSQTAYGYTRILQIKYSSALDTLLNGGESTGNLYTYPPELCYYGNSSLRTNTSDAVSAQSFPTHANWRTSAWSGWSVDGDAITNSTRGIAMSNTIQYGVSMLASKLEVSSTTLTDNGLEKAGQANQISLGGSRYLDWTGILIGGQPEQVGWDYLLKGDANNHASSNAIVYDKVRYRLSESGSGRDTCGIRVNTSGAVGMNYTLVYDNVDPYAVNDDAQGNVYVALEFENHLGQDFWGEQGLIRDGATFYLFAKLVPSPETTETETFWDNVFKEGGYNNGYLLPPYNSSGASRPIRRVFVQDIKTGVTFTFGADALKHAYVAIPDLRSAKISMGLDVDLNWTAGLTYSVPLGTR